MSYTSLTARGRRQRSTFLVTGFKCFCVEIAPLTGEVTSETTKSQVSNFFVEKIKHLFHSLKTVNTVRDILGEQGAAGAIAVKQT